MSDAQGEPFTVWISRDAISLGVYEAQASSRNDEGVIALSLGGLYSRIYYNGEWHTSKESALVRAEKIRAARIALHEKAINRLRAVQFS